MVKLISFPKKEYATYLEALDLYHNQDYKGAIQRFKQVDHLPHFKDLIMKPLIHSYLELKQYEHVYHWIEDTFMEDDCDEDYLIEQYLYTMILDHRYHETIQLIGILLEANQNSKQLKKSLRRLEHLAQEMIRKRSIEERMKELELTYQSNLVDLILNFDTINLSDYEATIIQTLADYQADPFIKYQLLKALVDEGKEQMVLYTNSYNEQYTIDLTAFIPIHERECFQIPFKNCLHQLKVEYPQLIIDREFIENIWINDYLLHFPKPLHHYEQVTEQLKNKVLYLMGETKPNQQMILF